MSERNPSETYGGLIEGAHIAGYSLERSLNHLEWLLAENRWRKVGSGFADVNAFLASIRLDDFRIVAEQRKRIAARIKQLQPKASNRAIAKAVGVAHTTVGRGANAPGKRGKRESDQSGGGAHAPPISGAAVAKLAEKQAKRIERQQEREATPRDYRDGGKVDDLVALAASGFRAGVVYADPPWRFEVYSGKGKDRSAERHYDTQSLDDIAALPIAPLCADNCALIMWAVMPEIPGALRVLTAWGFEYKTIAFVWVKENPKTDGDFMGMGYWTRANAEVCLLATRGSPERLAKDVRQVVNAPVSAHSRKPGEVRERIERLLNGPYLELYGRRAVPGWTVWGNEIVAVSEDAAE